jgi:hypothetical protein
VWDRIYPIDWREEFGQLAPHLNGKGGVVRVKYAGDRCAPSAFLTTLKSEYECKEDSRTWRSIRIDHQVYTVRYLSGIRDEFMRLMNLELPRPDSVEGLPGTLSVFTDVQAENVQADISNVTQNNYFGGDNPELKSRNRDRWMDALCAALAQFLKSGQMMVVINHGEPAAQDEFWRYLWHGRFDGLVAFGLFLVHMIDVTDGSGRVHDLAPVAHLEIDLPSTLGPRARREAVEDLVRVIERRVPAIPPDRARGAADALVAAHVDDIPRLHRKYAIYLMDLEREFG